MKVKSTINQINKITEASSVCNSLQCSSQPFGFDVDKHVAAVVPLGFDSNTPFDIFSNVAASPEIPPLVSFTGLQSQQVLHQWSTWTIDILVAAYKGITLSGIVVRQLFVSPVSCKCQPIAKLYFSTYMFGVGVGGTGIDFFSIKGVASVSYTHLDVYKRQVS